MKKSKRRSVAVSSAASRKGWRTRKQMERHRMTQLRLRELESNYSLVPTIVRIPKVDWRQT